jgi:hypothetical protein
MNLDKQNKYKAHLHIRHIKTGETVKSIGLRDTSYRHVERVMMGMLRNMHEDYYIDDSEVYDITTSA